MEIPWTRIEQPGAGPEAVVMSSKFELKTTLRAPAFLMYAMRLWRQARRSPGILGVSLRAAAQGHVPDPVGLDRRAGPGQFRPHRPARRRAEPDQAVDQERHLPLLVRSGARAHQRHVQPGRAVGRRRGPRRGPRVGRRIPGTAPREP
jgi:hypothetical protein